MTPDRITAELVERLHGPGAETGPAEARAFAARLHDAIRAEVLTKEQHQAVVRAIADSRLLLRIAAVSLAVSAAVLIAGFGAVAYPPTSLEILTGAALLLALAGGAIMAVTGATGLTLIWMATRRLSRIYRAADSNSHAAIKDIAEG